MKNMNTKENRCAIEEQLAGIFEGEDSIMDPGDAGILADVVIQELPSLEFHYEMIEILKEITFWRQKKTAEFLWPILREAEKVFDNINKLEKH